MQRLKAQWKSWLLVNGDGLGEASIKTGIFQGDSFLPLLFVIALTFLSIILNKSAIAIKPQKYLPGHHTYSLCIDDMKQYEKNTICNRIASQISSTYIAKTLQRSLD